MRTGDTNPIYYLCELCEVIWYVPRIVRSGIIHVFDICFVYYVEVRNGHVWVKKFGPVLIKLKTKLST